MKALVLSVLSLVSSVLAATPFARAEMITVNVTGETGNPTGSPSGGPFQVNGIIVWDSTAPGASTDRSDVAWDDPGIKTLEFAFSGGAADANFIFDSATISSARNHSLDPDAVADATFDFSGPELAINRNSEYVHPDGQSWLGLGNNDTEFVNSNAIFSFGFMTTDDDGIVGFFNPQNYHGETYSPISSVSSSVPEPSALLLTLIAVAMGSARRIGSPESIQKSLAIRISPLCSCNIIARATHWPRMQ